MALPGDSWPAREGRLNRVARGLDIVVRSSNSVLQRCTGLVKRAAGGQSGNVAACRAFHIVRPCRVLHLWCQPPQSQTREAPYEYQGAAQASGEGFTRGLLSLVRSTAVADCTQPGSANEGRLAGVNRNGLGWRSVWRTRRSTQTRNSPSHLATRPKTSAAIVTWGASSARKAACRIRHNGCNLCSASQSSKQHSSTAQARSSDSACVTVVTETAPRVL
jgi:hypothetical protein